MTVLSNRFFRACLSVIAAAGVLLLLFATVHARALLDPSGDAVAQDKDAQSALSPDWSAAQASLASAPAESFPAVTLPPPKQDNCLHCHVTGENKGIWTPLSRWGLFGAVGLVFGYGVYRSTSTYVSRKPFKSLTLRAVDWVDERYDVKEPLAKVLSKPVPRFAMRWWYCLGGITAFLFAVQATTGILLAFYYKPTPEAAYASIQFIESQVRFGAAIRAIHSWSANGMVLMCTAHMLRVLIMGVYKKPREFNWISGVFLLVLTLVFGFTGYLLPWDQRAFWASTVGTEIAAAIPVIGNLALVMLRVGWDISADTLSRFYGLHVIILPILTLAFMFAHFLMIRRLGIAKPL